ncbi:MAG: RecQ family ATP-dependent DNA helicase [Chitinophagales bacterium]
MTINEILKKYWGYSEFRPLQEDIINSVLQGHDTLALMPTGGGKSICFQVPALVQEGVCLVISPLIALMKDQVYNLRKRNITAAAIFSGMTKTEIERTLDNCAYGNTKFLYLSPERLQTELFKARLDKLNVSLLAIDEAHCISQWGYDFRPPYLQIADIRELLPDIPILALTATATKQVQKDIQEKLAFRGGNVFEKSFTRSNLSYSVFFEEDKTKKLLQILQNVPGTGIVYVRSRKKTKDIAYFLQKNGISADFYHAGLDAKTRSDKQDKWIKNQRRIIVCTNAFGMGIDKPDVRVVVHIDLPESLEAYYQEAGRAGRDGKKSYAALLYHKSDIFSLDEQLENRYPSLDIIRKTYQSLGNHFQIAIGAGLDQSFDFDMIEFVKKFQIKPIQAFNALRILEQDGYIHLSEAVYLPSRVVIRLNKEDFYKYKVANRRVEPYLDALLRLYGGTLYDHFRPINERQLAQVLRTSDEYVKNALSHLNDHKVIYYVPQTNKPQLTFMRERTPADQLSIDRKRLDFRRQVQHGNVNMVVKYVTNQEMCRSQQLVRYFGELDSDTCGVCDVCISVKKQKQEEERLEAINETVKTMLNSESLPFDLLVSQVAQQTTKYKQDEIVKVVRWMMDNEQLKEEEEKLVVC